MKRRHLLLVLVFAVLGFGTCFSLAIETESEVLLYLSITLFLAPFWCALALLLERNATQGMTTQGMGTYTR